MILGAARRAHHRARRRDRETTAATAAHHRRDADAGAEAAGSRHAAAAASTGSGAGSARRDCVGAEQRHRDEPDDHEQQQPDHGDQQWFGRCQVTLVDGKCGHHTSRSRRLATAFRSVNADVLSHESITRTYPVPDDQRWAHWHGTQVEVLPRRHAGPRDRWPTLGVPAALARRWDRARAARRRLVVAWFIYRRSVAYECRVERSSGEIIQRAARPGRGARARRTRLLARVDRRDRRCCAPGEAHTIGAAHGRLLAPLLAPVDPRRRSRRSKRPSSDDGMFGGLTHDMRLAWRWRFIDDGLSTRTAG